MRRRPAPSDGVYCIVTDDRLPPFDPAMMFKVLVIQTVNTQSDERAECLVNDPLSFMRFLGLIPRLIEPNLLPTLVVRST
jgi:hypothetical protein